MQEEFNIPKYVDIPVMRRVATEANARWILRNVFIRNEPRIAHDAKAAVKDWLARNSK